MNAVGSSKVLSLNSLYCLNVFGGYYLVSSFSRFSSRTWTFNHGQIVTQEEKKTITFHSVQTDRNCIDLKNIILVTISIDGTPSRFGWMITIDDLV